MLLVVVVKSDVVDVLVSVGEIYNVEVVVVALDELDSQSSQIDVNTPYIEES